MSARDTVVGKSQVLVITGPAGCGKSTIAHNLSTALGLAGYVEGDEYHTQANVAKMAANIPLTDSDRWDWLAQLRDECIRRSQTSSPTASRTDVVLACSALKRRYRDVLREVRGRDPSIGVHFIYLHADQKILIARVKARAGHYMKDEMVQSQFQDLEEPAPDEHDCTAVDVSGTLEEIQDLVMEALVNIRSS